MGQAQLRKWQVEASRAFHESKSKDFLAVATPGAGKTTFALQLAVRMIQDGKVDRVVVVAPTEHLKRQWADAAGKFGVMLDPTWSPSTELMGSYHGAVVTYAGVSVASWGVSQLVSSRRTLVVLDEVHHAGDSLSWGDGVKTAFKDAARRLLLSGSPWRSDVNPIPYVTYAPGPDGVERSSADYTYGYGDALKDGVVRPVVFLAYSGSAKWRHRDGTELESVLDAAQTKDVSARALRAALDPKSEWVAAVLSAADQRLTQVRLSFPDAGGLVLASNKDHARAYAKILEAYTGEKAVVVLSDDPGASALIEEFSAGTQRWVVAVRMISEGVDIKRIMTLAMLANSMTELYFTQAVGRALRTREPSEVATVLIPAVPVLLSHSARMEAERDHVLTRREATGEELVRAANRTESTSDLVTFEFEAMGASAHFDRVIVNGDEFGPAAGDREAAEANILTLSSLDSVRESLHRAHEEVPLHRRVHEARKRLAKEVSAHANHTGMTHAQVHSYLRQACGGPAVASATLEELEARIARLLLDSMPAPAAVPAQALQTQRPAAEQLGLFG